MDALAGEGVLFSEMFGSVPLTLPSHTSFLTGQFPSRHGVHDNGAYHLDEESSTIAEYLATEGYRTAAFLSSFQLDKKYGLAQGFIDYDDRMPERFEICDQKIATGPKAENLRFQSGQRRAGEITALTREWFDRGGSEPFFLWLHYFDPHETYDPPPPFDRMYGDREFPHGKYDGEITYLDNELGKLVELLREKGKYERTLIFLSADHGEGLGDHGEMYHDVFIYDTTLRIPFLIGGGAVPDSWPALFPGPVRSVDVLPTMLAAAGAAVKEEVQGTNLIPLLDGEERRDEWWNYCETYSPAHNLCSKLFGVRTEKWKYIDAPRPELYDIEADPAESANLIDLYPEVVERLRERLIENLPKDESGRREIDDETREKLAAIGYVHRQEDEPGGADRNETDPKEALPCIDGLHLSMLHFTYGEFDSSLAVLHRLKEECPGQSRVLDNIGNLQIRTGRYDDAIAEFTELTKKYPHYAKGYFWVGMGYLRTQRPDKALDWFVKAVARDRSMQIAQYNQGLALGMMNRVPEALESWEKAIAMDPKSKTGRLARHASNEIKTRFGIEEN